MPFAFLAKGIFFDVINRCYEAGLLNCSSNGFLLDILYLAVVNLILFDLLAPQLFFWQYRVKKKKS